MFGNRELRIQMAKRSKSAEPTTPAEVEFSRKVEIAVAGIDRVVETAGDLVIAYIMFDTVRKIMVARASRCC